MLQRKKGIKHIQLPASMNKVPPPLKKLHGNGLNEKSFLLFNNVFPSKSNQHLERSVNPNLPKPPKDTDLLYNFKHCVMVHRLLLENGVDPDVLNKYIEDSCDYSRHNHSWSVGVCDPTSSLPEGSIFITGVGCLYDKVFVTRCPCTGKDDGHIFPVVTEKPNDMSEKDWKLLTSMHLGVIIFSIPKKKSVESIPASIAGGGVYIT